MAVHKPVAYRRVRPVGNGGGGYVHWRVCSWPALGRGGSRRSLWIIGPVHPGADYMVLGRPQGAGSHPGLRSACLAVRDRSCRSEEHTSELQSLMRISYAVFCLKKKKKNSM